MIIRPAEAADLGALTALETALFRDADFPLTRRAFRYHLGHSLLLVAQEREHLCGYVLVLLHRRVPKLYSLGVAKACRGKGLGASLLAAALEELAAAGGECTRLEVRCDNAAALALYRRFNFEEIRRLPGFYRDGADALLMERHHAR